jgi:hypothetical protein
MDSDKKNRAERYCCKIKPAVNVIVAMKLVIPRILPNGPARYFKQVRIKGLIQCCYNTYHSCDSGPARDRPRPGAVALQA